MKSSFDPSPLSRSSRLLCASGALALAVSACAGSISKSLDESASDRGTGTTGGTGTGTTGGTGGSSVVAPPGGGPLDVNRVAIHRLNNTEYDRTMRDLLGVTTTNANTFITDEKQFGFDNIADALGMTDAQFEQYFSAADAAGEQVFADAALRGRIMTCTPTSAADTICFHTIIGTFGLRAWRRPLTDAEIGDLTKVATDAIAAGEDATAGVKQVVKTMLSSMPFLYRVEIDDDAKSTTAHPVGPYELASRLSYLGWSTMPDQALFDLAKSNDLVKDDILASQVDRLLADPKSSAFVSSFAGQWLGMQDLASHQVEPTVFTDWSEPLRQAMVQEGLLYFQEFLTGDGKMTDFFTRDVNFVDATLGKLYGVAGSATGAPMRVSNTGDTRVGFLGLAGFLTFSSFSYRTAPTLRGKWVLENLLCQDIPAPPPNVPKLDDANAASTALQSENVRVRLEAHRAMASCASCHKILDPIGMGLENFDAIGRYRTQYDNKDAIDSSGVLPPSDAQPMGAQFQNLKELATILSDPADTRLADCASTKLMTYALSRHVVDSDQPYLQQIRDNWKGGGMRELLKLIVLNDTFRLRRGEAL